MDKLKSKIINLKKGYRTQLDHYEEDKIFYISEGKVFVEYLKKFPEGVWGIFPKGETIKFNSNEIFRLTALKNSKILEVKSLEESCDETYEKINLRTLKKAIKWQSRLDTADKLIAYG